MRRVLDCLPGPAGESIPKMVCDMIYLVREAGANVKMVLLDREFFPIRVI